MPLTLPDLAPSPAPPTNVISGSGRFNTGGINVGSKVVGSGSAATTVPPTTPAGLFSSPSASGLPGWVMPVVIGLVALALAAFAFPRRKK